MQRLYNFIDNNLNNGNTLKDIKSDIYLFINQDIVEYCKKKAIFYNDKKYNKIKLHDYSNDLFEMILINWDESAETPIHDHAQNGCVLCLLNGELKETIFNKNLSMSYGTLYKPMCVSYMDNYIGYHKIKCIKKATSLHIYSPPNHITKIVI